MTLKALLKKKELLAKKMKEFLASIGENEMTAEQKEAFAADKAQFENLKSQIALLQDVNLDEEEEETTLSAANKVTAPSHQRAGGPEAKKEFSSTEEFMGAILAGARDPRLADCYREYSAEQRMDGGSSGGYAIPPQFRNEIQSTDPASALVRPLAQVIPAGNPPDAEIQIPSLDQDLDEDGNTKFYGGVTVAKVDEGGLKPETGFELKYVTLKPTEIAGYITLTDKLLRNWQAASNWATRLLRGAVAAYEDAQFLTGVGSPEGMVNSPAAYVETRAGGGAISYDDLAEMFAHFRGNISTARFVASYGAFAKLLRVTGDGGGATNVLDIDKATGQASFWGVPLVRHERMAALGSKGDVMLVDIGSYVIKDGSGPIVEVGYASGQWERNKRSIKITWNVDGRMLQKAPWKDESGYQTSSVVVLGA